MIHKYSVCVKRSSAIQNDLLYTIPPSLIHLLHLFWMFFLSFSFFLILFVFTNELTHTQTHHTHTDTHRHTAHILRFTNIANRECETNERCLPMSPLT